MSKMRRAKILVLLLFLVTLLFGCANNEESKIYFADYPASPYGDVVLLGAPNYTGAFSQDNIYYYLSLGAGCEAYDVHATVAMENGFASHWYPQYLTTVVIAVDRDQTDVEISGWRDLLKSEEEIGYMEWVTGPGSGRMLMAAICFGLGEEDFLSHSTLKLLGGLRKNGMLSLDNPEAPVLICYDYYAVALASQGRNLEIVVPEEGTLTYEKGILSENQILFPLDMDDQLLSAGYRLIDGRTQNPNYPSEGDYSPAQRVSDPTLFNEQTLKYASEFRRNVQGTYLYRSANAYEHNMVIIFLMVAVIIFFGFVLRRILDAYIRKILFISASVLIGWLLLRFIKYQTIMGDTVERYQWYGMYIFLLALPITMLWLSYSLDNPNKLISHRKTKRAIVVIYCFLLICVLTNDLHNFVFVIDQTSPNWSDDYSYNWLYFVVIGSSLLFTLASMVILVRKSWKSAGWSSVIFPLLFYLLIFVYVVGFVVGIPFATDTDITMTTVIICILYYATIMLTGLMPINRKYKGLFSHSHLKMQIVDENGQVILPSASAVQKDSFTLIYTDPIPGGFVLWEENIRELHILYEKLQVVSHRIEGTNALLSKEREVRESGARIEEKLRLTTMLENEIRVKREELSDLILHLPEKKDQKREIAKITLLLCYIKRRSNLLFQQRESERLPSEDLVFYLEELAEFAEHAGVLLLIQVQGEDTMPSRQVTLFYDFLYEILWECTEREETKVIARLIMGEREARMTVLRPVMERDQEQRETSLQTNFEEQSGVVIRRELDDAFGIELAFPKGGEWID